MATVTLDGLKVNYLVQGDGPPLLMLAPGGFDSTIARWTAHGMWKDMDAINTLSKHFRVIAYDRREAGISGGRVETLTWEVFARQARQLLDHCGVKSAYVLGGCMGVSVAVAIAARFPDICRGLLLHWPVGGYRWMLKGRGFFNQHIDFVRKNGLAAVAGRNAKNFWLDPDAGPWASPLASDPAFAAAYAKLDPDSYIATVEAGRDAMFNDTMPSGATGDELIAMDIPALIMPGADASHATSAAWAMKELMPKAEFWNVLPPAQTAANVLEQITKFRDNVEASVKS